MIQRHGWTLLFHECLIAQLQRLQAGVERAQAQDPAGFESNANVKLFKALSQLVLETVPGDPMREEYRQGNTMGPAFRHWRRAKIGRRFRLFFRFDSTTRIIIFAWVNDENTLRSSGSKSDPYAVFHKMLQQGNPPDDWAALVSASKAEWKSATEIAAPLQTPRERGSDTFARLRAGRDAAPVDDFDFRSDIEEGRD